VLSDVSDNIPTHPSPAPKLMATGTSTSDSLLTSFQISTVSLPPLTERLQEKISSGEFVDFIAKAMFSGNKPPESTKSVTVPMTHGNDNFFIRPTQASKNYHISIFNGGMEHIFMLLALRKGSYSISNYMCLIIHNLAFEYGASMKFGHYVLLT